MMTASTLAILPTPAATSEPAAPTPEYFSSHRARFLEALPKGAVAVLKAAPAPTTEVDDLYRQDSNFWYLTGFPEPEAVAVLRPEAAPGHRYTLFVKPSDWTDEQWTGRRAGVSKAVSGFGADEAFPIDDFAKKAPDLLKDASALYYIDGKDDAFRETLLSIWGKRAAQATEPLPAVDARPVVAKLRLVKDTTEIALLRRAVSLSVEAHLLAMRLAKPGRNERELKAAMVGHCLSNGAARMGYPPIVGSGLNSVVLHYADANRPLVAGEMIVNDTGAEFGMYTADVTRSYPVGGKFSAEQRAIYNIVLNAQKAGFAKARPGAEFHEIYDATVSVVVDGLLALGLLSGDKDELIKSRAYKVFYPHGSSHWLGLNVHDVGSYEYANPEDRYTRYSTAKARLVPGMVLTVEPGIYISEREGVDRKWWNLGARIEDDILITEAGYECLSCSLPREPDAVERAMLGR